MLHFCDGFGRILFLLFCALESFLVCWFHWAATIDSFRRMDRERLALGIFRQPKVDGLGGQIAISWLSVTMLPTMRFLLHLREQSSGLHISPQVR